MLKILIVEDDPEMREFLCDVVEMAGHQAHTAENGAQGVAQAECIYPDLVIQDVMLPDFDGWACMTRIRALQNLDSVPFIFCSGSVSAHDTFRAKPPYRAAFLYKPFKIADMIREMHKFLNASHARNPLPGPWAGLFI